MATAVAIIDALDKRITDFEAARPEGFDADGKRIVRAVKNAMNGNPDLQKCTPLSVVNAVMRAVNDGVILDGREAALIPYGDKAQYILMYRGMMKMAYRTGMVSTIDVHTVWSNEIEQERFDWISGDRPRVIHRPIIVGDKGAPAAFYSIVTLRGGGVSREIMSKDEVDAIRKRSKKPNPVWNTDYIEMAKKTVFRRHWKRLPFGLVIETHEADEFDQRPEIEPEDESQEPEEIQAQRQPRREKGAASSRLKRQPDPEPETIDMDPETGEIVDEREAEFSGDADPF